MSDSTHGVATHSIQMEIIGWNLHLNWYFATSGNGSNEHGGQARDFPGYNTTSNQGLQCLGNGNPRNMIWTRFKK